MTERGRIVLLAGMDDALARRIVVALSDLALQFSRVPTVNGLADAPQALRGDLILLHHAGERSVLERLLDHFEESGPDGRPPTVLALCEGRWLHQVRSLVGHGIRGAVLLEEPDAELRAAVCSVLGPAARSRAHLTVELAPEGSAADEPRSGTIENISVSGMLVRCSGPIPIGSAIRFMIAVPGGVEPVRGSADVVRWPDPKREGIHGVGVRFTSLSPADRSRLQALVLSA